MKKGLIRNGLVFSVIVLFIGVGIQPVFAEESITSTFEDEDCIECKVSDGYSHFKVNLLLTRIKTINNFVSVISGKDEELIPYYPLGDKPLCDKLEDLYWYYFGLADYYFELTIEESIIYFPIFFALTYLIGSIANIYFIIGCGTLPI